jgi:hypothetical protein
MTQTATYNGEEMTIKFTAETERCDYGVDRSPVWDEIKPETVEIESLEILGVEVDPAKLPPDLVEAIRALSAEITFEQEPM